MQRVAVFTVICRQIRLASDYLLSWSRRARRWTFPYGPSTLSEL